MHTVALLVPYVSAVACAAALVWLGRFGLARRRWSSASSPCWRSSFADLLASPIVHLEADDSYRYSTYARHILTERTLWGSTACSTMRDITWISLATATTSRARSACSAGEHRGLQIVNLGVLLVATLAVLVPAVRRAGPRGAGVLALFCWRRRPTPRRTCSTATRVARGRPVLRLAASAMNGAMSPR